jgi:Tol biopolymer transport system component
MLLCLFGLALLTSVTSGTAALAQGIGPILYNKMDAQANISVWQINPDGSGDQLVYPAGAGPIWSWDGQRVALSYTAAGDYNANVFVYDLRAGALQQVTAFNELVQTDQSTFVSLAYKAFSPDGQRMAVSAILHTQTTNGSSDDPFLFIYGLDGTPQALVVGGNDATSGRGVGVAWSPVEDILVYPAAAVTTLQGTGTPFPYVTALYLVEPVADVLQTGQYRQLTSPSAYATFTGWFWEIDFQPAISPDGRQVAYIRSVVGIGSDGSRQFSTPSIHVVNMDGSGDHPVAQFQQGEYVTQVCWSPDGSRLVFDLGRQAVFNGTPEVTPDLSSMALYTINADGSNPRLLQQAPAFAPAWNPAR